MADISKIKALKEKSKGRKPRPNLTFVIIAIIIISVIAILAIIIPPMINSIQQEKLLTIQNIEKAKENAIHNINTMFSKYPNDPKKAEFLTKIRTAKNEDEINKVIIEAEKYIKLKDYKNKLKNNIKKMYGEYYYESPLAQKIVTEIDAAKSIEEAGKIYSNNLESLKEDARKYYINNYRNKVINAKYVKVVIDDEEHFLTKDEFLKELYSYDLDTLKKLKVYKVNMCEATLPVLARYAGTLPKPGDRIMVYELVNVTDKNIVTLDKNKLKEIMKYSFWNITGNISLIGIVPIPITEAIVKEVYVVLPTNSISYSETKSSTVSLTEDGDTTSASKDITINYQLTGINNLLHAATIGKIDYNKLKYKFSNYGYKLNKLEDSTQLFDPSVIYLLVIEIPSDKASEITMLGFDNSAIVKINE